MSIGDRLRPLPVAAFAGVTLLIWTNRVWLAWTDPQPRLTAKLVSTVPITAFVVAAGLTLLFQLRGRSGSNGWRALVTTFAAGTILYWAIRLPMILSHDHPIPFKVVHSVLAVVSVALAGSAWLAIRFNELGPVPSDPLQTGRRRATTSGSGNRPPP